MGMEGRLRHFLLAPEFSLTAPRVMVHGKHCIASIAEEVRDVEYKVSGG
jgi:hypothetical protein